MKNFPKSPFLRLLTLYNAGRTPAGCRANAIKLAEVKKTITIFVVAFCRASGMGDNLVVKVQNPPGSGMGKSNESNPVIPIFLRGIEKYFINPVC